MQPGYHCFIVRTSGESAKDLFKNPTIKLAARSAEFAG